MTEQPLHELQSVEVSGDIPWGMIKERELLHDRSWMAPQGSLKAVGDYEKAMKAKDEQADPNEINRLANARKMELERLELSNGIRYAVIKDVQTGQETFDDNQYHGLISCDCGAIHDSPAVTPAEIISGTDLGNGYKLKMMIAGKPTSRKAPMSESFVEKEFSAHDEITGQPSEHSFHYQVDPHGRHFSGRYDYRSGNERSSIWIKTAYDEASQAYIQGLAYDVCIADVTTNNQISFLFGSGGKLEELQLAGRSFLRMEGAEPEMLAPTADSQRGVVVVRGDDLKTQRARSIVKRLLGVEYKDNLTLDTKGTLGNFIQNADGVPHRNPREVLSFKDATRVPEWQPALLE